jgi:O-antigen ligase
MYAIGGDDRFIEEKERVIEVGDKEVYYSSADHRWLLFHAYAKPLAEAGLFGYGYGRKTRLIEEDYARYSSYFYSIDNTYIGYTLSYGYLGMSLFLLMAVVTAIYLGRAGWNRPDSLARLAGGLFGAIVAANVALLGVGLTRDYSMFWPFSMGLGVCVAQLARATATRGAQVQHAAPWAWQRPGVMAPGVGPGLMPHSNTGPAGWKLE